MDDDNAGLRCIQMSLMACLKDEHPTKTAVASKIEEYVQSVSRAMHYGSVLASHWMLYRMESNRFSENEICNLVDDQAFWRNCMTYTRRNTKPGKYSEVRTFFEANRTVYPDLEPVPLDSCIINQAARKMRASVKTMLCYRLQQRVEAAIKVLFKSYLNVEKKDIALLALGKTPKRHIVLTRETSEFIEEFQDVLFHGVDFGAETLELAVALFCKNLSKPKKKELAQKIQAGEDIGGVRLGPKGLKNATVISRLYRAITEGAFDLHNALSIAYPDMEDAKKSLLVDTWRGEQGDQVLSEDDENLLQIARVMLFPAKMATASWLKRHVGHAFLASYSLLSKMDQTLSCQRENNETERKRCFPILPLFEKKRQFITINKEAFKNICVHASMIRRDGEVTEDFIRSVLRFPTRKNLPSSGNFSFDTDGVSIVLRVEGPAKASSAPKLSPEINPEDFDVKVSVDPGVQKPAQTMKKDKDGSVSFSAFTNKEYYITSGIVKRTIERARRDRIIRSQLEVLRTHTLEVGTSQEFKKAMEETKNAQKDFWDHVMGRWTSMLRLSSYSGKRRSLDNFWAKKVGLSSDPKKRMSTIIGYGDGAFKSRGGRLAPVKAMKASASRYGIVVNVPEAYTSKVCSFCHSPTKEVFRVVPQKKCGEIQYRKNGEMKMQTRTILGLRRCCSNECSATPLKGRDRDAAISIMQVLEARECPRPECYTREGYRKRLGHN